VEDFLRKTAEFTKDKKLEFPWHPAQFSSTGRVENDLKQHH
jgi:hypothetical protein